MTRVEWREDVPRLGGTAAGYAAAYEFTGNLGPTEAVKDAIATAPTSVPQ